MKRALARLATWLDDAAYGLMTMATRVRKLPLCATCGAPADDWLHEPAEECRGEWSQIDRQIRCRRPWEHHAFRRRWWLR